MNRRAVIIGVAGFLVFALAWYFLLWRPRTNALDDAKTRRGAAEQQETELQASINRLKAAAKNEPRLRAQLETLRTSIPDDPNLAQFILDTNDAATKAGLDFVSISPSLPTAQTATGGGAATTGTATTGTAGATATALPPQIAIQLQMTGGYFQMIDFLNRLNDLPRLTVVDTITVGADNAARLTVSLNGRMFVRAIPAGFGPPGSSTTSTTIAAGASTTTTAVRP